MQLFFRGSVIESTPLPITLIVEFRQLPIAIGNVIVPISFQLQITKLPISGGDQVVDMGPFGCAVRLCCERDGWQVEEGVGADGHVQGVACFEQDGLVQGFFVAVGGLLGGRRDWSWKWCGGYDLRQRKCCGCCCCCC